MTSTIDYKAQAREFAEWLLNLQGKGRRRRFNDVLVRGTCPRPEHDDQHPSFSFNSDMDAYACSCSRGKGSELREALGWKPSNGGVPYSRPAPAFGQPKPPSRQADDVYRYAGGNQKLKWRIQGAKSVIQWRNAGKVGMQGDPGLYRLEEAVAAAKGLALIHVSESESDADALAELGLVAIATPHGAASPWKEVPRELAGARLVVWEHQDDAGRKYAAAMADVARKANCDVAIVRPAAPWKDVRDWILDGATAPELLAAARAGLQGYPEPEKAADLMKADLPELDYIIRPLVAVGNMTLLQGEPKGGKSCFALLAAIGGSSGEWRSERWDGSGRPRKTLFISYEDGRRRLKKRLNQYTAGMTDLKGPGIKLDELVLYGKDTAPRLRLDEPGGANRLRALVHDHGIEFLIIDTLSHLSAADENSKKEMQPVMDALTDLAHQAPCAILLIHHASKPSKDTGRSVAYRGRGSSAIAAAPDAILDWGKRDGNVTTCSFLSKDDDGDKFQVEYLPDGDDVVRWKLVEMEEKGKEEKYAERKGVIEALSKLCLTNIQGATISDVAKEAGISISTARRILKTLADEGSIQRKQVEGRNGPVWRHATISHVFPTI